MTILYHPQHPPALPSASPVTLLPVAASPFGLTQQWQIPRLLRLLRADLYHSAYIVMPYLPGVPTVLTVYDLIPLLFPEQSSGRARLIARWANRLALRAARQVLAISEATRTDYIRRLGVPPQRIMTIPLAADSGFTMAGVRSQESGVSGHALRNTQYILYLGSNKPHKNLVRLIEAWGIVASSFPHSASQLVIAGAWDDAVSGSQAACRGVGIG